MLLLQDDATVAEYRTALMGFLNGFSLEATAILSLARRTEPVVYEPGEQVLAQGAFDEYVYFLVAGDIVISVDHQGRSEVLGERTAVTLLGEISYFNQTPATASVSVKDNGQASFLRLSYERFGETIEEFPQIQHTLARIGEMRIVSQMDGFASYSRFMDMIGWRRDRLAVNRALFPHLEDAIMFRFLPKMSEGSRILEVADGPGIVCEIIREHRPEWTENLFLQATHLEDAILNPLQSYPSDFSRAKYLRDRFDGIVTLQVFENAPPDQVDEQLEGAATLLKEDGVLLIVRLRVVDVSHATGQQDSSLFFKSLESLVRETWPDAIGDESLINVTFVDADVDPMMEWNTRFCDAVVAGELKAPKSAGGSGDLLLKVLLRQAARREFNPEEINFHWLAWHAARHKLILTESHQDPEFGFYYQLYRLGSGD